MERFLLLFFIPCTASLFNAYAPYSLLNHPEKEEIGLNIHHVPTVILYNNGNEIGRIIEYPVQSLEEDMVAILNGTNYTPNYSDFRVD